MLAGNSNSAHLCLTQLHYSQLIPNTVATHTITYTNNVLITQHCLYTHTLQLHFPIQMTKQYSTDVMTRTTQSAILTRETFSF